MKNTTKAPKIGNGLVLLTRGGMSFRLKWVCCVLWLSMCSGFLPHGAVVWSEVCECGIN